MAFDYSEVIAVADELTREFGRQINFIIDPDALDDPNKPWGTDDGSPETELALFGVFVPPNTVRQFGITSLGQGTEFRDMLTYSEQVIIVYQGANDLRNYTYVDDPGKGRWKITATQVLQPAADNILAFVGVAR